LSTLAEIEAAIERLPPEQWAEIRRWMDSRENAVARQPEVDWSQSAAVLRPRAMATQLSAEVVADALATVRA
jgi:hypothetical protein